ncbi:MAG: hypothetical protein ACFFAN_06085 [Promethearchaeota archaeon]
MGLLIILKYRKLKNKTYIWWGIAILGMGLPWIAPSLSFLNIIYTGKGLSETTFFLLGITWISFTSFCWMLTISELKYKEKQKVILLIYGSIGIAFEIYYLYFVFTDPSVIGTLETPPIGSVYRGIAWLYILFVLISITISLLLFIWDLFKSESPEVRLKAKFLLVGMISFFIGSTADALFDINILTLFIMRTLIITSAVEFYIGWILPESIKKIFIKE